MSRKKNAALVMTGVLVGTMLTGPAVHAAEEYFKAYRSNQAVYLDGQQIQLEAYTIDGSNYVKLRDVGEVLDFNVYWDGAVRIDSDAPYTGIASTQPQQKTPATPRGDYTIHTDHCSREDFSQSANPAVFTEVYDRELYNTMRQTLVDMGEQDGADYEYAYTMVSKDEYSAVKQLMGRLDSGTTYDHHLPPNFTNYYEYLDYFAMSAEIPENYKDAIKFIQPAIQAAKRLGTDAEKVTYLNDYLKTLLEYDRESVAGITQTFSPHSGEIKGACAAYARAFKVLCGEAAYHASPSAQTSTHGTWSTQTANGCMWTCPSTTCLLVTRSCWNGRRSAESTWLRRPPSSSRNSSSPAPPSNRTAQNLTRSKQGKSIRKWGRTEESTGEILIGASPVLFADFLVWVKCGSEGCFRRLGRTETLTKNQRVVGQNSFYAGQQL